MSCSQESQVGKEFIAGEISLPQKLLLTYASRNNPGFSTAKGLSSDFKKKKNNARTLNANKKSGCSFSSARLRSKEKETGRAIIIQCHWN